MMERHAFLALPRRIYRDGCCGSCHRMRRVTHHFRWGFICRQCLQIAKSVNG